MFDSDIKDFYLARMAINQRLNEIADALDPGMERLDLTHLSGIPNNYFESEAWTDVLRADPSVRESFYNFRNDELTGGVLDALQESVKAELDFNGLCAAIEEFYRTSNQEIAPDLMSENQTALTHSRARLESILSTRQNILEDEEDNLSAETQAMVDKVREQKREEYLGRLRGGYDYRTLRAATLNIMAGKHMAAAEAFSQNAGLQAAVQILRLENDPLSHGNEDHLTTYAALKHDIDNADLLTRMAAAAAPESTVQALKAENGNGGPTPPKPN